MKFAVLVLLFLVSCGGNPLCPDSGGTIVYAKTYGFNFGNELDELCKDPGADYFTGVIQGTVDTLHATNAINDECTKEITDLTIAEMLCEKYKADESGLSKIKSVSLLVHEVMISELDCAVSTQK